MGLCNFSICFSSFGFIGGRNYKVMKLYSTLTPILPPYTQTAGRLSVASWPSGGGIDHHQAHNGWDRHLGITGHTVDGSEIRQTYQLRLVVEIPLFTRFLHHPKGGCLGFLNHQQYDVLGVMLFLFSLSLSLSVLQSYPVRLGVQVPAAANRQQT